MSAPGTSESPSPWAVAALLAGVFLNAALLNYVGTLYPLAGNLLLLALTLAIYAAFLGWGVCYYPLKLGAKHGGGLDAAISAALGETVAWLVRRILIPLWASAWFLYLASHAIWMLSWVLLPRVSPHDVAHIEWRAPMAAIWLVLVAPAASGSLARLARSSVFVVKVSCVLILGLALSTARYVPESITMIRERGHGPLPPLEPMLLLWAVPPLFACGALLQPLLGDRRGLRKAMAWGIVAPLAFAVLAALLTMTGAAVLEMRYAKVPWYLHYAAARFSKLGWVKLLLLTFTLLTASRLAANLVVNNFTQRQSVFTGATGTVALLVITLAANNTMGEYLLWQFAAIPFAPLAGVLCGVWAATGTQPDSVRSWYRACAIVAWLAGCAVAASPIWMPAEKGHYRFEGHLLFGWVISFLLTWLTRRLYPLMQNSVVRERR